MHYRVPSDREAWYHELFMRGRQDDIHLMERVTRFKGEGAKAIPNLWEVRVCIVLSCVIMCSTRRLVIWLLHLAFFGLHLTAFTPHVLTYVTITSLSS